MFWKTSQNSQINTGSSHREVFCQKMFLKLFVKFTENTFFPESPFQQSCRPETLNRQKQPLDICSFWRAESVKQSVLKNFPNFAGKNVCWSLFLIKLEFWGPKTLLKKTPTQVFSCEICKIFRNSYFPEDLQTACSETPMRGSFFKKVASLTAWKLLTVLERDSHRYFSLNFEKFLGKLFCRTSPSNHFSHDVVFTFCRSVRFAV